MLKTKQNISLNKSINKYIYTCIYVYLYISQNKTKKQKIKQNK